MPRAVCAPFAFLALPLLVPACHSGWKLEGTVTDSSATPLASAKVDLRCPPAAKKSVADKNAVQDRSATTDDKGRFSVDSPGDGVPLGCTLEVKKGGFLPQKIALATACTSKSSKDASLCAKLTTTVAMKPVPKVDHSECGPD